MAQNEEIKSIYSVETTQKVLAQLEEMEIELGMTRSELFLEMVWKYRFGFLATEAIELSKKRFRNELTCEMDQLSQILKNF